MAILPDDIEDIEERQGSNAKIHKYIRYMRENIEHWASNLKKSMRAMESEIKDLQKPDEPRIDEFVIGETYPATGTRVFFLYGYVYNSGKNISVSMPLPRRTDKVHSVKVEGNVNVRGVNGQLRTVVTESTYFPIGDNVVSCRVAMYESEIRITIWKADLSAFYNAVDQTPVHCEFTGKLIFI